MSVRYIKGKIHHLCSNEPPVAVIRIRTSRPPEIVGKSIEAVLDMGSLVGEPFVQRAGSQPEQSRPALAPRPPLSGQARCLAGTQELYIMLSGPIRNISVYRGTRPNREGISGRSLLGCDLRQARREARQADSIWRKEMQGFHFGFIVSLQLFAFTAPPLFQLPSPREDWDQETLASSVVTASILVRQSKETIRRAQGNRKDSRDW